ncbi:aminoglycoside phosphotransferase family protein [Arthrobacter sp. SA17]
MESQVPASVERWLGSEFGTSEVMADTSWPRNNSRVWRVRLDDAIAYLKVSPSFESFYRERSALAEVLPGASATTPMLLGADESLLTLLTTAVDGEVVRTLDPPPLPEIERTIHARAGRAVRSVHVQVEHLSGTNMDVARANRTSRLLAEAEQRLTACRQLLGDQAVRSVGIATSALADAGSYCELGYIHGDFQPRNWLWSSTSQDTALIDFEEAQIGYVVEDFGWLFAATWAQRDDLRDAFLDGYGRQPSEREHLFLAAATVLGSLKHIADGERLGIAKKVTDGFGALRVSSGVLGGLIMSSDG